MYLHFDHWSKIYIGLPEKISDKLYVLNLLLILQKTSLTYRFCMVVQLEVVRLVLVQFVLVQLAVVQLAVVRLVLVQLVVVHLVVV